MEEIILKVFDKNLECLVNEKGCYICLSLKSMETGYYSVIYLRKKWRLHRLVYTFYTGFIEKDFIIMHSCDNKLCINPEHLVKGTYSDNSRDMCLKERSSKGEKHYRTILTKEDILYIRRKYRSRTDLAKQFNMTRANISKIQLYKTWK